MSTLKVTNIQATGETASRAVSGVAAAWVNFVGAGTIAARDSVNVSSLTDNGTGDYSVNYTSAMATGNNSASALSTRDVSASQVGMFHHNSLNAGSVRIVELAVSTFYDPNIVCASVHGDLA